MQEKILTLRTDGKTGSLLLLNEYELAKESIVFYFLTNPSATYDQLLAHAKAQISGKISGDMDSLISATIPDMEARDFIEKIPESSPVQYRLKLIRC